MEYQPARRVPRYNLVVDVELTDVQSGAQIKGRTKKLSVLGCGLDALRFFPKGTNIKVKLSHRGAEVNVLATVVYASTESGMGIAFTNVQHEDERILKWWLAEHFNIQNREK